MYTERFQKLLNQIPRVDEHGDIPVATRRWMALHLYQVEEEVADRKQAGRKRIDSIERLLDKARS